MLEAIDAEIQRLGIALPAARAAVASARVLDHSAGENAASAVDVREDLEEEDSVVVTMPVAMAIWSAAAISGGALGYFAL